MQTYPLRRRLSAARTSTPSVALHPRVLRRPDGQRALFTASALEFVATRDGHGSSHLPASVVDAWGQYLRAHWQRLPAAERAVRRGWLQDYWEVGDELQRHEAELALAFLDGDVD